MTIETSCRVKVIFFGAIRGLVKTREDHFLLPLESATIGGLVEALSNRYGERFARLLSREAGSAPLVTFFLNGRSIGSDEGEAMEAPLGDGSEVEVSLVSQMTGGF